jgi:putative ABC transport system permease protein
MFARLLIKSLARRRSRKVLAVLAVWIGVSLVTALLTLALDVGDKMNRELQSFGANIRLLPATAAISVKVGGYELAAAAKPAYLEETNLDNLRDIFWANNLLGVVPRLWVKGRADGRDISILGVRFARQGQTWAKNSAPEFYGYWNVTGSWPIGQNECLVGSDAARALDAAPGGTIQITVRNHSLRLRVSGVVSAGGAEDTAIMMPLRALQRLADLPGKISAADISALTTPENKLAERYRVKPQSLTPTEYERWYCTPYPGSVAADIQQAVPGSVARVVRRVAETQGAVLSRIKGLVGLLGLLAAVASTLSVMGVLTSAVLERRMEVALLQAIGAHGENVLRLFLSEAALLGLAGGVLAGGTGMALGDWLVQTIFSSSAEAHYALLIVAPLLGLLTALAASALPVWHTVRQNTAEVLHGN